LFCYYFGAFVAPPKKHLKTEPDYDCWYSISNIIPFPNNKLVYTEGFYTECAVSSVKPAPNNLCIYCDTVGGAEKRYIVRRGTINPNILHKFEKSATDIIFAEYSDGRHTVEIQHMHQFSFVGNELFTPEFVMRCLEYDGGDGSRAAVECFSGKYTIIIMDNKMNIYELNETMYIVLGKDEVIVCIAEK
jgi:hypothetical protein